MDVWTVELIFYVASNDYLFYVSGYATEKKSLWREMCSATKEQLSDPYLKAAFAFLVDQSSHYKHVLVSGFINYILCNIRMDSNIDRE